MLVLPALFTVALAVLSVRRGSLAVDTANNYVPAARALVHGLTPYHLADIPRGTVFASPPVAALIFAPLLLLPAHAAEIVASVAALGALFGALRLMGVRDWRCYAATCLWLPTLFEFQTANLSAIVALLTAAVWRYRDRWLVAALAAGLLVGLKIYGWPLLVFLLVSRRFRAAAAGAAVAVLAVALPWAGVGFVGAHGYLHILRAMSRAEAREGYWLATTLAPYVSWSVAEGFAYGAGALALAASAVAAGDRRKFVLCLAATLLLTPVVWLHYFVVMVVVLAFVSRRFSAWWLLPLVLWVAPTAQRLPHGEPGNAAAAWQCALVSVVVGALFVVAYRGRDLRARSASVLR